ncbi:MAG: HAMP domain-containing sensor histidine kinase [Gemmatimonas sp.]
MKKSTPSYDLASSRQSRRWSNRLWILSGFLGIVTAVHVAGVVHDDRSWRASLRATAQATAEQHAERINERLQLFAMETFAPVSRYDRSESAPSARTTALVRLASAQAVNESCRCKTTLPVAEFFRVDVGAGNHNSPDRVARSELVTRKSTDGATSARTILSDSLLRALARMQASRSDSAGAPAIRLTFDPTLQGNAVVTMVQRDSTGQARNVYGFVAPAHTLMQTLFSASRIQVVDGDSTRATSPDTLSLQIGVNDSFPLYGKLSGDRPYRGKVFLHGPMDGLGLTVALSSSQIRAGQLAQPTDRLWALGLLTLGTVLVIVIAISTQRRETFLARARSDFIAGTSHDFRMPLAQILLASETLNLRPEVSGDERARLGKSIVRETHRLIAMVENVLLFSRSGAVEIKPLLQSLPVRDIFEDVRDAVQLAAEDARQTITIDVDATVQVRADRQLLRQALVNLVDNAMKYGAVNQTITLGARVQSTSQVHLWVDDQGPGVPESQRARIFEPYERLTRDQSSERAGSGLGLAVVSQIASALRGRVWVESAPGGGARFAIELSAVQS